MAINPDLLVDREDEQALFANMLTQKSAVRVLMFAVGSGAGKSSLLQRLGRNCQTMKPPALAALVHLKKPEAKYDVKTPYDLAGAIVEALSEDSDAMAHFEQFIELQVAYEGGNREPFGFADSRTANTYYVKTIVTGVSGTDVTGANIQPSTRDEEGFDERHRKRAEKSCVDAFLDNFTSLLTSAPAFILIDGWDGCDPDLRWWVENRLVRPYIAEADGGPGDSKLHLVVAGLPLSASCPTGITKREFGSFFDELAYARHVHQVTSLSPIEERDDYVFTFMERYGGDDIPPAAAASYRPAIAEAMKVNLVNAIALVQKIRSFYLHGGGLSA